MGRHLIRQPIHRDRILHLGAKNLDLTRVPDLPGVVDGATQHGRQLRESMTMTTQFGYLTLSCLSRLPHALQTLTLGQGGHAQSLQTFSIGESPMGMPKSSSTVMAFAVLDAASPALCVSSLSAEAMKTSAVEMRLPELLSPSEQDFRMGCDELVLTMSTSCEEGWPGWGFAERLRVRDRGATGPTNHYRTRSCRHKVQ